MFVYKYTETPGYVKENPFFKKNTNFTIKNAEFSAHYFYIN